MKLLLNNILYCCNGSSHLPLPPKLENKDIIFTTVLAVGISGIFIGVDFSNPCRFSGPLLVVTHDVHDDGLPTAVMQRNPVHEGKENLKDCGQDLLRIVFKLGKVTHFYSVL